MFNTNLLFLILGNLLLVKCEPPVATPFPQYGAPFSQGGGYSNTANNYNNNNYNNAGHVGQGVINNAPLNTYGSPNNYNDNSGYNNNNHGGYRGDDHHGQHDDHGYGEPKAYEFGYQVKDDYTGTNYNRQEQSDGNQVTGSYRVALPDGRTQIVTYYADWKSGFHADVRYEGEAQYPQVYNTYRTPTNNAQQGYNYNQNYNGNQNNQGFNNNNQGAYNNYNNYNNNLPTNQYGPPVNPLAINNMYAALSQNYIAPSSTSAPHYDNNNFHNNNINYNNNQQGNYDSYANSGYGNKVQPTQVYGAP